MNVYDTANKLALEIKTSEEYIQYKKIKEEIEKNLDLKSKVQEFGKIRQEVQMMSLKGETPEKEKTEKVQSMYMQLIQDEKIKNYFDLELKFSVMIADINKIISEALKDIIV